MVYISRDSSSKEAPRVGGGCLISLGIVAAIGVGLGSCSLSNNYDYSEGTRVGAVNKFSRKGLVFKTWEGQMALEGIVSNGNTVGANVWDFSLDASKYRGENIDELVKQIQSSMERGKKVRLQYHQVAFGGWPWRESTNYFVDKVDLVEDKK